jgi:hypothetical protein
MLRAGVVAPDFKVHRTDNLRVIDGCERHPVHILGGTIGDCVRDR